MPGGVIGRASGEWTGKPLWRHMLTMIKLLLPKTDIHPHLAGRSFSCFCLSIGSGTQAASHAGQPETRQKSGVHRKDRVLL